MDQQRRLIAPAAGGHLPETGVAADGRDRGIGLDPAAALFQQPGIARQHAVDIDILGVALDGGAGDDLGAQDRHQLDRLRRAQPLQPLGAAAIGLERVQLVFGRHHHLAARRQQAALRDPLGRLEKPGGGGIERAQGGIAVVADEDRRRAAGGVIADLPLGLEHADRAIGGKLGTGANAGDATADDENIRPGHDAS